MTTVAEQGIHAPDSMPFCFPWSTGAVRTFIGLDATG